MLYQIKTFPFTFQMKVREELSPTVKIVRFGIWESILVCKQVA
jgi:hypothetical protein